MPRIERLSQTIQRMLRRKKAYQMVLGGPGTPLYEVLVDLGTFCKAFGSCWDDDAREHARNEGRREVWQRIQNFLKLEPEQLAYLATAVVLNKQEGEQ